jgi:translation initiation factor eIF-2B subunit delta
VITTAEESARDFLRHADVAAHATTAHALELIGDGATVLTHSRSSTVLAALLGAHRAGRYLHVMATESRPLFEGRALAETLAGEGVRITLIAEAAAALVVKRADFVLFGADRVTPDGLVNKIGTHMIALAAQAYGIAVHALCDTSKFIAALPPALSDQPRGGDELWPDAPPSVALFNRYFEPTPLRLFTTVITEDGALRPEAARHRAAANSIDATLQAALNQSP